MTKLCLMTGTAGDRAVGTHEINSYICTTYFDMLVDKLSRNPVFESKRIPSKYKVASNMDTIPGVKFYQYDFSTLLADQNEMNPSWNKWAQDPAQNEVFTKTVLGEVLATKTSSGMIDSIRKSIGEEITGIMLFVPRTMNVKENMGTVIAQLGEIANEGYHIIELTGNTTNGLKAEEYTKEEIKKAKDLNKIPLIVSAGHIGSRSFSIPEINVVLLMYDGGSAATTGQNMSRGSTRGQRDDKVAHIFSLSIDPTRDDSMIQAVLETAVKVAEESGEDIIEAAKRVLRAMNVLAVNDHGNMVPVDVDDYLPKIMNSKSLKKVVGSTSDATKIMEDPEAIQKLLEMKGEKYTIGQAEKIGQKGKTFAETDKGVAKLKVECDDQEEVDALKLFNKIKQAVTMIADNAQNIAALADSDKFTTALDIIIDNTDLGDEFEECFNIEPTFVKTLVTKGMVNEKLLDLVVYTYYNEQEAEAQDFFAEFA